MLPYSLLCISFSEKECIKVIYVYILLCHVIYVETTTVTNFLLLERKSYEFILEIAIFIDDDDDDDDDDGDVDDDDKGWFVQNKCING